MNGRIFLKITLKLYTLILYCVEEVIKSMPKCSHWGCIIHFENLLFVYAQK